MMIERDWEFIALGRVSQGNIGLDGVDFPSQHLEPATGG
jgi:hypothetical protein